MPTLKPTDSSSRPANAPEANARPRLEIARSVLAVIGAGAFLALAPLSQAGAEAVPLKGRARVLDGDTLAIGDTRVRLYGIDAPETAQRCLDERRRPWGCGTTAAHRLERLIDSRPVTCESRGLDDYSRTLGVCQVAGRELNAQLVREGLAWAFVRYSEAYDAVEREARAAKRGVFAAENVAPWEFRAGAWKGAQAPAQAERARDCPIKGNISGGRIRIYHLPWQRDYATTRIAERAGERWFCNEGEAKRAGWRKAAR
jgi:endonuclease YncB( thermonuclease family)